MMRQDKQLTGRPTPQHDSTTQKSQVAVKDMHPFVSKSDAKQFVGIVKDILNP